MGIEKEAPVPSLILSSSNHTTSSKTVKAKPVFYDAEMNKLSLSPQKQHFTMYSAIPSPSLEVQPI